MKIAEKLYEDREMKICEIYRSICGEGSEIGVPAIFVRSTGCNIFCKGCDTSFAFTEGTLMNIREILHKVKEKQIIFNGELKEKNLNTVFLTGGEITIQENLIYLVKALKRHNFRIIIQTNGTNFIPAVFDLCDFVSSDVKTPCFEVESNYDVILNIIKNYINKSQLKFVINNENDIKYCETFLEKLVKDVGTNDINIVLQPYNSEMNEDSEIKKLRWLIDILLDNKETIINKCNVRYLPRLHILVWGGKRGV